MRTRFSSLVVAVAVMLLVLLVPATAYAHKQLHIPGYDVEVGWGTEPAYVGQLNSVQVLASTAKKGVPVEQFGGALKVQVIHGKSSVTMLMKPAAPGDLRAWFIPGASGAYTFHLTGRIGTQPVDVSATSGPGSFDPVQAPLTFPASAAAPQNTATQTAATAPGQPATSGPALSSATLTVLTLVAIVMAIVGMIGGVLAFIHLSRD